MRPVFLFVFLIVGNVVGAQVPARRWAVGPATQFQVERRTARIYSGHEERRSVTQPWGVGLRAQYRLNRYVTLGTGLTRIERTYRMNRPFDHCALLPPGQGCLMYLAHISQYAYQTLEVPLSAQVNVVDRRFFQVYAGSSWTNAWRYATTYLPYVPVGPPIRQRSFGHFSGALWGQVGFGINFAPALRMQVEYVVRLANRQVSDALLEGPAPLRSGLDAHGLTLALLACF